MANTRSTLYCLLAVSLLVSANLHNGYEGAYVRSTPGDKQTYWIGAVSTTIPFAFWALATLMFDHRRRKRPFQVVATMCGYAAGWTAMTALTLWIVSLPRGPELSSTMGIAVMLTPILFVPIFPILFVPAYLLAYWLLREHQAAHDL